MLRRPLPTALALLPPAAICAWARLKPAFARFWARAVAGPTLALLRAVGSRLPFSLLEWGAVAVALILAAALFVRWLRRGLLSALRVTIHRLLLLLLALIWLFAALWYPLYFAAPTRNISATPAQLAASCRALIGELNAAPPDFSAPPNDLPAKFSAFPFWMDALNITGFASFFTGEALISPQLPESAVPFVAVHEAMHLRGYADEGETNLAAWDECLRRGGMYAASARLWALKDSLALLQGSDPDAWASCISSLSPEIRPLLRRLGGATAPPNRGAAAAFSLMGVGKATRSYENLALYLAAQMPV